MTGIPEIVAQAQSIEAKLKKTLLSSTILFPAVEPIFTLIERYRGFEVFFCFSEESPAFQILDIAQSGQYDNLTSFLNQVAQADFWCARVLNSPQDTYWNPLVESFADYSSRQDVTRYVLGCPCPDVTMSDTEYPATSAIALWLKQHLKAEPLG